MKPKLLSVLLALAAAQLSATASAQVTDAMINNSATDTSGVLTCSGNEAGQVDPGEEGLGCTASCEGLGPSGAFILPVPQPLTFFCNTKAGRCPGEIQSTLTCHRSGQLAQGGAGKR